MAFIDEVMSGRMVKGARAFAHRDKIGDSQMLMLLWVKTNGTILG